MEMNQTLTTVSHRHPIIPTAEREVRAHQWRHGETVRELLLRQGFDAHSEIVIKLNDRLLTVAEWDLICPQPDDLVIVQAVVSGGGGEDGGGSNVGQIVMMVVIIVLAYWTGGAAAGAWGAGGASSLAASTGISAAMVGGIVTGVVMMAGSMVVGALFKPSGKALSNASDDASASPTYSLSGGSNSLRAYEPMPVVMGVHRIFPDYGAKPYTEYQGQDQYLYQLFNFGLSTLALSDFRIGETPLTDYSDVTQLYSNSAGQIPGFPGNVDSVSGGALIRGAEWTKRTSSADAIKLAIDVEGQAYFSDGKNYKPVFVVVEVSYSPTGANSWTVIDSPEITHHSQATLRKTFIADVPAGQYDVRARLVSVRSEFGQIPDNYQQGGWNYSFSTLRSYQNDSATYVGQQRYGLIIKASGQLNGVVQQLSALASASCLVYQGGSWVTAQTSNPAWWFLDFAIGRKNADGEQLYGCHLDWSGVDVEAIIAWAAYCAAEGLTCNLVLDRSQSSYDVLQIIAKCGFASPTWASGKLGVIWDKKNAAPVAAFGMSNIIKGTFSVQYLTENLADEIVVTYVDADDGWMQKQVRVAVPGVSSPGKPSTVELMGCTNSAMAGKYVNYLAGQQFYRKRMISWETDFEGFTCQRGDVVILSHDLTQWGYSGRFVSVDENTVTLEREVPRNGAVEHLLVVRPDGEMQEFQVVAGTGEQSILTLDAPLVLQDDYPAVDHRWFFAPLATPGKKVKIVSVRPVSQTRIALVATDEYPEFYDSWGGTFIDPPINTLLPASPAEVIGLQLSVRPTSDNGQIANRVTASWRMGGDTLYCDTLAMLDGATLSDDSTSTGSLIIDVAGAGLFKLRVTPQGPNGPGRSATAEVSLSALAVPAAPNATATGGLFLVQLHWTFGDDRQDISATEIWFSTTNDRNTSLRLSSEPFPSADYVHAGLSPAQNCYYWLRVVDKSGAPSAWFPSSATAGLHASPSSDASALLTQLFKKLGNDQLASDLASRIDLIDVGGQPDMAGGLIAKVRAQGGEINTLAESADLIGERLLESALKIQENTDLLLDAGVVVTPETGEVYIYGVREAEDRLDSAEIRLNAAESSLTLKATSAYVDEQIALAVLDPSQIADLSGVTARLGAAEVGIDGLNAAVNLKASLITVNDQGARLSTAENNIDALQSEIISKVENATFDAAENRLTTAETRLTAYDNAGIINTVSDYRALKSAEEDAAYTALRNVLTGETQRTENADAVALARTELTAKVNADLSAEATARLALAAQIANASAAITEEQTARATGDAALSQSITTLQAQVASGDSTNAAAIQAESSARAAADAAEATARLALAASVANNSAQIADEQTARATGDAAEASARQQLQARLDSGDFAAVKQESSATASALGGIEAKWSVKAQTMQDGVEAVSGIELLSGADGQTVFAVLANKFLVYQPDGGGTPQPVMAVGMVNGVPALGFNGNAVFDGSIFARHLQVGSLSAISANLGNVTAGSINIGGHAVINPDGSAYFDSITVARQLAVANGTVAGLAGTYALTAAEGWTLLKTVTIDTGYSVGAWWSASDRTFSAAAGISAGTVTLWTTGGYGAFYANWSVTVKRIFPKSRWNGASTIALELELWAEVDGQTHQIAFPAPSWAIHKVT